MARSKVRTPQAHSSRIFTVKPVIEILEDRYVLDAWGLNLDFGTLTSAVGLGYQQAQVQKFDKNLGYGWSDIYGITSVDRPAAPVAAVDRAFHMGKTGTFLVNVPNGSYRVTLRMGDPTGPTGAMVGVLENRYLFSYSGTAPKQIVENTFDVNVTDQQLSLFLLSRGGITPYWALNSMKIVSTSVTKPTNQPPTNVTLSTSTIPENRPVGSLVGILASTDPNAGDTFTYTLVAGSGSSDNSSFSISGNQLVTASVLDFEAQPTRTVRVRTTDAGGLSFEKSFTINVQNVNEAPTAIALSNNVINQNAPVQTLVGTLTTSDPDKSDTFSYTLVTGSGSNNNAQFLLKGNSLLTSGSLTAGSYSIRVRSTDAGGLFTESTFVVTVQGSGDSIAPTVSFVSPANNSTASNTVNLLVSATDNVGVVGVQYYLDSNPLGVELTTGNYSFSWDTTRVSNGTHTLKAIARDAAGNLGTSAVVTVSVSNVISNNPLNKPLLSKSDFTYLGAFDLPFSANGWSTAFSTNGLTHRYVNGQLQFLTTSHVYSGGLVYEFNYPGLNTNGTTPKATVVKEWGDVYTGNKWVGNDGGGSALGSGVATYGLYYDQNLGRLYWNYGHWYNATNSDNPSFGYSVLNDTTGVATGVGAWSLENRPEKFSRGGTLRIPQWFADSYTGGKSLGVGFGGYFSIIGTGSLGPSLAAVADPNITTSPNRSAISNVPLVGYPTNAPARGERDPNYTSYYDGGVYPTTPGAWNPTNGTGYWTWSDLIYGAASWIDTPSLGGVLYIAKLGTGDVFYQSSDRNASGAEYEWMVYDPKDLAAVATGVKQQWEIQPKYHWVDNTLPVSAFDQSWYGGDGLGNIGGVTFDPTNNRLYVLASGANPNNVEWYPRMYVYQVGAGAPTPTLIPSPTQFQFGVTNGPTANGYLKVSTDQIYSSNLGYGWLGGGNRGILNGTGAAFNQQGIQTSEGSFGVSLANGTYQITLQMGSPQSALDNMGIYMQGQLVDQLNTAINQSLTKTYTVAVTDGFFTLRLKDLGGVNSDVMIQTLSLVKL